MELGKPKDLTIESFIRQIEDEEKKHRGNIYNGVVFRGTGYTMSAQTEDLFAVYMKEILADKAYVILVDVSMTIGKKCCRPDIVIVGHPNDDWEIIGILDVKTSLGWVRDKVHPMAKKYSDLLSRIVKNKNKVYINGVGGEAGGVSLDGWYPVAENVNWDVFVRDVWGNGAGVSVLDQIEEWNNDEELSSHTKIWWGRCWFPQKENLPEKVNSSVFNEIANRVV